MRPNYLVKGKIKAICRIILPVNGFFQTNHQYCHDIIISAPVAAGEIGFEGRFQTADNTPAFFKFE
ncbi:MAG: hypothetical protein K8S20_11130 [Chloroflexi bacterium]|nr:hypothetical protein [Chloroflexota bacterium]